MENKEGRKKAFINNNNIDIYKIAKERAAKKKRDMAKKSESKLNIKSKAKPISQSKIEETAENFKEGMEKPEYPEAANEEDTMIGNILESELSSDLRRNNTLVGQETESQEEDNLIKGILERAAKKKRNQAKKSESKLNIKPKAKPISQRKNEETAENITKVMEKPEYPESENEEDDLIGSILESDFSSDSSSNNTLVRQETESQEEDNLIKGILESELPSDLTSTNTSVQQDDNTYPENEEENTEVSMEEPEYPSTVTDLDAVQRSELSSEVRNNNILLVNDDGTNPETEIEDNTKDSMDEPGSVADLDNVQVQRSELSSEVGNTNNSLEQDDSANQANEKKGNTKKNMENVLRSGLLSSELRNDNTSFEEDDGTNPENEEEGNTKDSMEEPGYPSTETDLENVLSSELSSKSRNNHISLEQDDSTNTENEDEDDNTADIIDEPQYPSTVTDLENVQNSEISSEVRNTHISLEHDDDTNLGNEEEEDNTVDVIEEPEYPSTVTDLKISTNPENEEENNGKVSMEEPEYPGTARELKNVQSGELSSEVNLEEPKYPRTVTDLENVQSGELSSEVSMEEPEYPSKVTDLENVQGGELSSGVRNTNITHKQNDDTNPENEEEDDTVYIVEDPENASNVKDLKISTYPENGEEDTNTDILIQKESEDTTISSIITTENFIVERSTVDSNEDYLPEDIEQSNEDDKPETISNASVDSKENSREIPQGDIHFYTLGVYERFYIPDMAILYFEPMDLRDGV